MISFQAEKKLLQITITIACLVPLSAGFCGAFMGAAFLGGGSQEMDSHMRYLSGLLFAIGLSFLSSIAHIERHADRIQLLTLIVVVGGIARLAGFFINGVPALTMFAALVMELVVTPLICVWQFRLAKRAKQKNTIF